jgi:hypothetical protein
MIYGAGPNLDNEVARRLGDEAPPAPPYSTDPTAADQLTARLEGHGISQTCESVQGVWYCTLWIPIAGQKERLATGSGETRPLALCRAVVNLPGGRLVVGGSTGARDDTPAIGREPLFEKGMCQQCGTALASGGRAVARLCPVCSYRLAKPAQIAFEQRGHARRRRRPSPIAN